MTDSSCLSHKFSKKRELVVKITPSSSSFVLQIPAQVFMSQDKPFGILARFSKHHHLSPKTKRKMKSLKKEGWIFTLC